MNERQRALVISPEFPYPPVSGGTQRTFHILQALSRAHRVDLVTFSEHPSPEGRDALSALCSQIHLISLPPHPKRPLAFFRRNLSRAIRGVNPLIDRFADPAIRQAVNDWLAGHRYDLILMEHSWIAPYIEDIRASDNRDAFTVLDAHNVESELWRQYYQKPARWWAKPALYRYWQSARLIEQKYFDRFDVVLAVSESDREKILRLAPRASVAIIPNGIELPSHQDNPSPGHRPPVVGFVGSLDYPPNHFGLEWFLARVWPRIAQRLPEVQLVIIGRGDQQRLKRLCRGQETVRLAGAVPDLAPYLRRMAVMVVPLWHGSGTRIKILEAWAHGIAVVSTSRGAEGLRCQHMENIWIADEASDFAAAVIYLLTDHTTRRRLAQSAYEGISAYSWSVIEEQLQAVLDRHWMARGSSQ